MNTSTETTFTFQAESKRRRVEWLSDYASVIATLYAFVDVSAVITSAVAAHWFVQGDLSLVLAERVGVTIAALVTVLVFAFSGLYTSWRGRGFVDHVRYASVGWLSVVALLISGVFLLDAGNHFDKTWVVAWLSLFLFLLLSFRLLTMKLLRLLRTRGMNHKRVLVVGGGRWAQTVLGRLSEADWLGLDVVGIVDHEPDNVGKKVGNLVVRGGYDSVADDVERLNADEVWICLPLESRRSGGVNHIDKITSLLSNSFATQRFLPDFEEMRVLNRPMTNIMGLPVVSLNASPHYGLNRLLKVLEDKILAMLILCLIFPIMLAIAVAIKLDSPGPVIFKQRRHGFDGKMIKIYKFRSMSVSADNERVVKQATKDDPRVTAVGRFLRRTSLDELPQFFNVLQGRMSIVGPRPHAVEHNEYYKTKIDSYMQRQRVKPGITGYAQVNGLRGETRDIDLMRQRVNLDLYYIEHWSLWFDLRIIGRTLVTGFRNANAY